MAEGGGDDGRIRTRDELVDQLRLAALLEHGLAIQYLFAAFSLKNSLHEGLSQAQLNTVRRWKAILFRIASQEMLHLCQVMNLTIAAGGDVDFWRENFPRPSDYTPMNLAWELSPFSEATLWRFREYEEPETVLELYEKVPSGPLAPDHPLWSRGNRRTVGQLYTAIETAFRELDVVERLAVSPRGVQATGELVDFPQLKVVQSTQDACDAIDLIVRQGEARRQDDDSHFETFCQVLKEYRTAREADSAFEPVRNVVDSPRAYIPKIARPVVMITDSYTRDVEGLNSAVYSVMLLMLGRVFADDETVAGRQAFSAAALRLMTAVLVPLGEALARLPVGEKHPGATAGPSFEIDPDLAGCPKGRDGVPVLMERLEHAAREALELSRRLPGVPVEIGHAAASLAAIVRDLEAAS